MKEVVEKASNLIHIKLLLLIKTQNS